MCRMFNQVISGAARLLQQFSDHNPLLGFHRWQANLRILEATEVTTVPHAPLSHPFMEQLIGTVRRELLDHVPF